MTEYGRGAGPEPWHPEDPLYGDAGGWAAQQQPPYDGQQQPGYGQQQYDPYQYQQGQPLQQPQQPQPQQHPQQQPQEQYYWDTGQQVVAAYDPYAQQPPVGYDGQTPDYYGTPEAYPPPQPPGHRMVPEQAHPVEEEPEEHPFFSDGAESDDDGHDEEPRGSRRGGGGGRSKKKKKSRNGVACLFVSVVLVGGVSGVGYYGYQFYQARFGAAPDYEGAGSGKVQVEIPQDAGGYEIGDILVKNGVVKSRGAFVAAQEQNPNGKSIQPGVYILKKGMSAANAVKMMLDPSSLSVLIIPEGMRNAQVYAAIDKKLGLSAGTTKAAAKASANDLGLPAWAKGHPNVKDPLEGFLFPARYPVALGMKPEAVLKQMVARANEEYEAFGLEDKAKAMGLEGPWQLLTLASLVQVEGKTHDDFRKMSEVIYNRLKPTNTETNQKLQFDSALNYLLGQSEIKISEKEANSNQDPYNTYTQRGLTPGPISNPGNEALTAAVNPTDDGWMYFVATDGMSKTEFAKTYAEFQTLKDKFNDHQGIN
ncbi:endolytic transglycosylase MltG [Streptomyces sannanensis]|uniref:Endolytic murein transglycosylase n=1 Tax=Streptomyces sannanensis TaxID=285536 RepID=A0ABP6S696_9ACTN